MENCPQLQSKFTANYKASPIDFETNFTVILLLFIQNISKFLPTLSPSILCSKHLPFPQTASVHKQMFFVADTTQKIDDSDRPICFCVLLHFFPSDLVRISTFCLRIAMNTLVTLLSSLMTGNDLPFYIWAILCNIISDRWLVTK